jgi:hypothetical protein
MQPSHNQHMKHARLLKVSGLRTLDEAPVTEQRRTQNSANLRRFREEFVDLIAQSASNVRQKCHGSHSRHRRPFHQFRCA